MPMDTMDTEIPNTPLFGGLNQDDWPELLAHVERLELQEGDKVFLQGELADAFFVVVSGSVEVRVSQDVHGQQVLAHLGSGSVIGESSLFLGGTHSASVYASEPVALLCFRREEFLDLVWRLVPGAVRVLHNMAHAMAVRLRAADLEIAELSKGHGETGVVHVLGGESHGKIPSWGWPKR